LNRHLRFSLALDLWRFSRLKRFQPRLGRLGLGPSGHLWLRLELHKWWLFGLTGWLGLGRSRHHWLRPALHR
jgi:hypothetical protein